MRVAGNQPDCSFATGGTVSKENPFKGWINLAEPRLGAEVVSASDDFFAPRERLIKSQAPIFIADKYDDHGKWMDGWESRRKRCPGHDHCVIRLGQPGLIQGFDVDTSFFTGNYPPEVSIDACSADPASEPKEKQWLEVVPRQPVKGDFHNFLSVQSRGPWNWLRLHIYPDGGVARLRVYGQLSRPWTVEDHGREYDLAAVENGARTLACNDMHFGAMENLIAPGRGVNMGDGWETRRRRKPGNDWLVLALGHRGVLTRVEVDTAWFKGNYPDRCSLEGVNLDLESCEDINWKQLDWQPILPAQKLGPDRVHRFSEQVLDHGAINLVRLNIFPDGGVSRLRLFGKIDS
jgi:allantoicase